MQFSDKVVLITGASSGIGKATAEYFASLGASLAITGRNAENLNTLAGEVLQNASKPLVIFGDITNEIFIKNLVESVINHFGRLDVLVNNAGVLETGTIETTTLESYDRLMNTNVRSIYHLTMLAVPHLVKAKGCVVNVSSVAGIRAFPGVLTYCMSKAIVDQFTSCVALELAPKQVRINSVNPGVILTEIHKRAGMNQEQYEQFLKWSESTHPLGRPGTVEEVAQVIAFLASEEGSFITGASIPIDGGRHALCPI